MLLAEEFPRFKLLLYFTVIAGSVDVQYLNYRVEVSKRNANVNLNQRKTFTQWRLTVLLTSKS